MNDMQKMLKKMVVAVISEDENLEERTIDTRIDELSKFPMLSGLSEEEINEVRSIIKSEFSIKLYKGVLIEEKGQEKWVLA